MAGRVDLAGFGATGRGVMQFLFDPLARARHGVLRWSRPEKFNFASDIKLIPLTYREVHRAAHHFPLCVRRTSGGVGLVAVLADSSGRNIHVDDDGFWTGPYIPFALRTHPFRAVAASNGSALVLAVARDGVTVKADGEYAFYEDDGSLTEATQAMHKALSEADASSQALAADLLRLEALNVLAEVPIEKLGPWLRRQRCYGVQAAKLKVVQASPPDALAALYETSAGAMELAEMIAFSHRVVAAKRRVPLPAQAVSQPAAEHEPEPALSFRRKEVDFLDYGDNLAFDIE